MFLKQDNWISNHSALDRSVNFISKRGGGFLEARYVRREDDYFIVYMSSQTGCKHACRFCHLTSTGQTSFNHVTVEEYLEQADKVLEYYDSVVDKQGTARRVNFNWMARGEALSNPHLLENAHLIIEELTKRARARNLVAKFNISTIMPVGFDGNLVDRFKNLPITFYYSMYSTSILFRKRWIPNSYNPEFSLMMFKDWQNHSNMNVVLHWAFIENENDSEDDVMRVCRLVQEIGLNVSLNLVRYNPPNDKSAESSMEVIENRLNLIKNTLGIQGKIVPKVGFDVNASCGMFVDE